MSSEDEGPKTTAKPAMSRFLRSAGDSSSDESDSDSEDESESDDDEAQGSKKKSRFIRTSDSEDDGSDEDVKRVVKSAQAKRLDEMEASGKLMDNALKINDWVAISSGVWLALLVSYFPNRHKCFPEFDKLIRMVQRQQNVAEPIPPFFIRTLTGLDTSLNSALAKEKESKKKMNASNARALTAMKQKVKKVTKEYENDVKQFQTVSSSANDSNFQN